MIYGIGVDIVDIRRVEAIVKRFGNKFSAKVLTENEVTMATTKDLASVFAAKEAFVKALGTGFVGIGFKDIEIFKDGFGRPYILTGERIVQRFGKIRSHLSISHEKDYVVAMVVIERL